MTVAGLACTACGTELPSDSKFCNKCGTPVGVQHSPAEYKQVTVLFADVAHSMDIAAAVGAERLREIMAELVDRAGLVIQRYGGTVDKFTGDGIMAVFGAPVAMEDHAVRACLAALGIQEECALLAVEVSDRDGVDFALRVGLNSGQVIAGEVGSTPLGYTTIGEQVGMAQRMESVAPPGGVMLSASTARLVDGAAVLGEPELVHIKGADEPVAAHRLFGMGDQHRALLEKVREDIHRERFSHAMSGVIDMHVAKEKARSGDLDGAIELSGTIVDDRVDSGEVGWAVLATVVLVEALLRRRAEGDLQQAQAAIDRLADVPTEPGMVVFELWPLRWRALLARAHGDEAAYRDYRDRYRAMARSLEFEGHMKWAEAMP